MDSKKNILRIFYLAPEHFIVLINLLFVAISIKYSYPFIFVFLLVLALNLLFKLDERVVFTPLTFPFIFGAIAFFSNLLAKNYLHGAITATFIHIILLLTSVIVILRARKRLFKCITSIGDSIASDNFLINICLLVITIVFWTHSILFWYFTHHNSTAAHFVQTAYSILQRGYFAFPFEDFTETGDCCYPNLLAHFFAISAPFMKWKDLIRCAANMGSFLVLWGLSLVCILIVLKNKFKKELTVIILALFCSYAFFSIIPEFGSDTPVFVFFPAFFYFLIQTINNKRFAYFYLAFSAAIFSFWFRSNVAVCLGAVLAIFVILHRDTIFPIFKSRRVIKITLLVLTLYVGTYWLIDLFRLTGNPTYPYSGEMGTVLLSASNKNILQELLYHFFAINVFNTSVYKVLRGILHGFTYSTVLTLTTIAGIVLYFTKRFPKMLNIHAKISCFFVVVLLFIFIFGGYHSKFLYLIYLPVVIFSLITLVYLIGKVKYLSSVLIYLFLAVFLVSYLMTGFGHTTKRWAIAEYILKGDKENLYYIKDYKHYIVAEDLKKHVRPQDRVLFFHLEPGFQISYYLNLRPFNEELAYKYPSVGELYQLREEKQVLNWLKEHNIKVIVFGYPSLIDYYVGISSGRTPHLLPLMLKNKSKYFIWKAEDVVLVPD